MEHTRSLSFFSLSIVAFLFFFSNLGCVRAYKNYTVGDSLGWFDELKEPKIDYQKWASGKHFSLGDFLIFKTDSNHSVVQTYNATTYKSCDYNDADGHDTTEWSNSEPAFDSNPTTVSVPLVREGPNYFFYGNYDGEQCEHGQRFKIDVAHGKGLPQSLLPPYQQAPALNVADYANSVPDTVVSSNFDDLKDVPGDDDGNRHVKATFLLAKIYPDEWTNFLQRVKCQGEEEIRAKDFEE